MDGAFQCVSHDHVLAQLSEFGVPGFVLRLLGVYLAGHQQRVIFESEEYEIGMPPDGAGIPQGGKISALIWNIFFAALYTADLTKRIQVTSVGVVI